MDTQVEVTEDVDAFDRYINATEQYVRRYAEHLIRWLPPFVGFAIFLGYFFRNHFYPSFDLFQFSSLLLSAAVIGFGFVLLMTAGVALPGLALVYLYINDKRYKAHLRNKELSDKQRDRNAWAMWLLCFVLPFAIHSLLSSALLLSVGSSLMAWHLIAPALVALGFGIVLQIRFELPKWAFLQYFWVSYLALSISNVLAMGVMSSASTLGWIPKALQLPVVALICLLVNTMVGFVSPAAIGGVRTSLCFSVPLALGFALYNGALSSMPERVMSGLGLGQYTASEIVLDADYCGKKAPTALPLDESCTFRDTKVIWSLGEILTLSVVNGESTRQVQIPSRFIKAIIRNPG
ncbi:hypothetical protein QO209_25045 [Pseudomonas citronellolis]|uniref:hypothetical protein n=1 Tax=Pseudomonas citronellolis TaxID=53408 RepID=UPI0026495C70|nr:hypothetical protein [Pseudomonas citronellolis]MDN6875722.1 hypothetical protein [Pseudomonas citronellolis]